MIAVPTIGTAVQILQQDHAMPFISAYTMVLTTLTLAMSPHLDTGFALLGLPGRDCNSTIPSVQNTWGLAVLWD